MEGNEDKHSAFVKGSLQVFDNKIFLFGEKVPGLFSVANNFYLFAYNPG